MRDIRRFAFISSTINVILRRKPNQVYEMEDKKGLMIRYEVIISVR